MCESNVPKYDATPRGVVKNEPLRASVAYRDGTANAVWRTVNRQFLLQTRMGVCDTCAYAIRPYEPPPLDQKLET